MKKNTIVNLVLIASFAAGILFWRWLHYSFFGGICSGASAVLFFINMIGERQLKKASARLEKTMRDRVLAIESDEFNFKEDE